MTVKTQSMLTLLETSTKPKNFYSWERTRVNIPQDTSFSRQEFTNDNIEVQSPFRYLKLFFDDEIISCNTENTNLQRTRCCLNKGSIKTCDDEIKNLLAILLRMRAVKMTQYRM